MPRPVKHDEARILGAAATLVATKGPSALTMAAIGAAIGAPNGSLYHRFRSRDHLLGRLWLSKATYFQDRWADAMETEQDARPAGLAAALSLPRAVRDDFEGARIMLLHRREDFLGEGWSTEMREQAESLGRQQQELLVMMTRRLFSRNTKAHRQAAAFAVVDLPFSAVRRYVAANEPPPPLIDELIAAAYAATIARGEGIGASAS